MWIKKTDPDFDWKNHIPDSDNTKIKIRIRNQKKIATRFLESVHLMNIDPNPMILGHELDPVYIFCSFLHEVSNFLSFIQLYMDSQILRIFWSKTALHIFFLLCTKRAHFCRKFYFFAINRKPLFSAFPISNQPKIDNVKNHENDLVQNL